jgi:hypothetical protein
MTETYKPNSNIIVKAIRSDRNIPKGQEKGSRRGYLVAVKTIVNNPGGFKSRAYRVGWSLCRKDEPFSGNFGINVALNRALKDTNVTPVPHSIKRDYHLFLENLPYDSDVVTPSVISPVTA